MLCPLQKTTIGKDRDNIDIPYFGECLQSGCAWWNPKGTFNPETKQYEGECCVLTLSKLKIKGGTNVHAY